MELIDWVFAIATGLLTSSITKAATLAFDSAKDRFDRPDFLWKLHISPDSVVVPIAGIWVFLFILFQDPPEGVHTIGFYLIYGIMILVSIAGTYIWPIHRLFLSNPETPSRAWNWVTRGIFVLGWFLGPLSFVTNIGDGTGIEIGVVIAASIVVATLAIQLKDLVLDPIRLKLSAKQPEE